MAVVAGVFALDGIGGIAVLAAAASVGMLGVALGLRPAYASGGLIVPSLAYSLGFAAALSAVL